MELKKIKNDITSKNAEKAFDKIQQFLILQKDSPHLLNTYHIL